MVENMTPTEKLVAEARELDRRLKRAQKSSANMHEYGYAQDRFCDDAEKIIPALCDALEQAQATLEQTWEWDMYKAAQKEIERLRKELAALASESVKRDIALAKLEAEVMAAIEAQNSQRWIPVSERLPDDDGDLVLVYRPAFIGTHSNPIGIKHGGVCGVDLSRGNVTHWMPLPEPPKGED